MSAPDSDLDAGLDADLETYPYHQVALLAAAPWAAAVIEPSGTTTGLLLTLPVVWAAWSAGRRRGAAKSG